MQSFGIVEPMTWLRYMITPYGLHIIYRLLDQKKEGSRWYAHTNSLFYKQKLAHHCPWTLQVFLSLPLLAHLTTLGKMLAFLCQLIPSNNHNNNEILIKHGPLLYTRAQRTVQEKKKTAVKLGQVEQLDNNNNHKIIQGQ